MLRRRSSQVLTFPEKDWEPPSTATIAVVSAIWQLLYRQLAEMARGSDSGSPLSPYLRYGAWPRLLNRVEEGANPLALNSPRSFLLRERLLDLRDLGALPVGAAGGKEQLGVVAGRLVAIARA